MNSENIVTFLNQLIEIEDQIVKSLDESLGEIENPAVKEVLKGISLDSMKHAQMYSAAIELIRKTSKALSQRELHKQKRLIEKHIEMEASLIRRISEKTLKLKMRKSGFSYTRFFQMKRDIMSF